MNTKPTITYETETLVPLSNLTMGSMFLFNGELCQVVGSYHHLLTADTHYVVLLTGESVIRSPKQAKEMVVQPVQVAIRVSLATR